MDGPRIGMDYRPAMRRRTGIGRYVAALTSSLAARGEDLRLFGVFHRGNTRAVRVAPPGTRLVAWPIQSRLMDLLGRLRILPADRAVGGCDLFHHTNYILAVVSPRTPQVMTIHDLAFLREPSCHTPRAAHSLGRIVRRAAGECRGFLVPSEATARDCEELLGIPRDRIFLTPLGVSPEFFAADPPEKPGRPYLLAVGTLEPRKNHPRLIRAFSRAARDGVELRIAGAPGWLFQETERAAQESGAPVRLLGHLSEEELRRQIAGATAVLYPSLLEGFGLPVLEAMAAGRAVLTSDREPLRTLAGDAALLVDPCDEEAIAHGIARLLRDAGLRRDLEERGPRRARLFTWEACAAATARAYRAVLA